VVISLFTLLAAALLAFTFSVTEGPIAERRAQAAAAALAALLPGAHIVESENLNISGSSLTRIDRAYSEDGMFLGTALSAQATGYGGPISMMVAFDRLGYVQGLEILSHAETPGIGAVIVQEAFRNEFVGRTGILVPARRATNPQEIDVGTGASFSLNAVLRGINDATRHLGFENQGAPLTAAVAPTYPRIADLIPNTRFVDWIHANDFALEWIAASHDATGNLLGYVFFTSPRGYGGPIEMAVVVDIYGNVENLYVIDHMETWTFGGRQLDLPDFGDRFVGLSFEQNLNPDDINTTTFATISLTSVARGINDVIHHFNRHFGFETYVPTIPTIAEEYLPEDADDEEEEYEPSDN